MEEDRARKVAEVYVDAARPHVLIRTQDRIEALTEVQLRNRVFMTRFIADLALLHMRAGIEATLVEEIKG